MTKTHPAQAGSSVSLFRERCNTRFWFFCVRRRVRGDTPSPKDLKLNPKDLKLSPKDLKLNPKDLKIDGGETKLCGGIAQYFLRITNFKPCLNTADTCVT